MPLLMTIKKDLRHDFPTKTFYFSRNYELIFSKNAKNSLKKKKNSALLASKKSLVKIKSVE